MAILKPDSIITVGGVTVNEYFLTKHNTNKIDMPSAKMEGSIIGVTIHNTDMISVASGTTPAEQYTRATVNGNMGTTRVHFYVDDSCAWQNLPLDLSGWHAADGNGNGNRRTIAIECIMSKNYTDTDKKAEDNAARPAAYLLKLYKLDINSLFTHTHWLNIKDGKTGTVDELNTMKNSYKNCPAYILPHWAGFKARVAAYIGDNKPASQPPVSIDKNEKILYRVRKSWNDVKSQIGAYESFENAKAACKDGYTVFDNDGKVVYSKEAVRSYAKGTEITLNNVTLFASAYAETGTKRSGTFFLYDGMIVNGRMRITATLKNCGNTPIGRYVTGWVRKSDI